MELGKATAQQPKPVSQGTAGALASINKSIDDTIKNIEKDADVKERRSSRQHWWDQALRLTMAILAVAAPAPVTYSTAPNVSSGYKLSAILLSGLAGASATIQAILALQQNYVRNAVDALDLRDLKAQLEHDREEVKGQDFEMYGSLKVLLSDGTRKYREIIMGRQKARLEQVQTGH